MAPYAEGRGEVAASFSYLYRNSPLPPPETVYRGVRSFPRRTRWDHANRPLRPGRSVRSPRNDRSRGGINRHGMSRKCRFQSKIQTGCRPTDGDYRDGPTEFSSNELTFFVNKKKKKNHSYARMTACPNGVGQRD